MRKGAIGALGQRGALCTSPLWPCGGHLVETAGVRTDIDLRRLLAHGGEPCGTVGMAAGRPDSYPPHGTDILGGTQS